METYSAAAGHRFSQHMLFVLAVAFYRRHSSLGKCQGSFFIISSEIIKFLSPVGTHIPQNFRALLFPTGEVNELRHQREKERKWHPPLSGMEGGAGQKAPDLDKSDHQVQEQNGL